MWFIKSIQPAQPMSPAGPIPSVNHIMTTHNHLDMSQVIERNDQQSTFPTTPLIASSGMSFWTLPCARIRKNLEASIVAVRCSDLNNQLDSKKLTLVRYGVTQIFYITYYCLLLMFCLFTCTKLNTGNINFFFYFAALMMIY